MNIYDLQSWQYNHSDELAKQMFAHQALATSFPYRDPNGGAVMPVPTGSPWNMQGIPWGMPSPQPSLVQFTGQNRPDPQKMSPVLHCKRKPIDIEPVIPAKQLITEEKMAAHLSGLHISSDYTSHASSVEMMDVASVSGNNNSNNNNNQFKGVVVLADEIKNLKNEPLLPAALIERVEDQHDKNTRSGYMLATPRFRLSKVNASFVGNCIRFYNKIPKELLELNDNKFRLEKPCMSLVVWKPKGKILETVIEENKRDKSEEESSQRSNGLLVPEHTMDMEM